jgi:SAM-dependent methyltransferase
MASAWKSAVMRIFWPLMRGWPDEGRRIVQGPHVRALLNRAAQDGGGMKRVLNGGAGEGGYSRLLLELPGVESLVESDYGWRQARPPQIDRRQVFFCSSLVSIPAAGQSFNLVLCTEVLEHIAEDQQALDEIARVMTPGGWLLMTVPTPPAVPDPAHVREGYRPDELASLLGARGFEVVEQRFCMYFFFRYILRNWSHSSWTPRIVIRALSYLDRLVRIGPPMDLLILAKLTGQPAARRSRSSDSAVHSQAASLS